MVVIPINDEEMSELNKEYEASLKSIETENIIDRIFYRPIGFLIARALRSTRITPNMVTVVSIFVGAATGFLFYHSDLKYTICGILCLVFANILDCVDGQLASKIGRILDGFAGDIWFASIYVGLALRLANETGSYWFFALAALSGMSHLLQANITDYYKTLHLYFISKEKGAEFQTLEQVVAQHKETKYGITKFFYFLYRWYTMIQVKATPVLQQMLRNLHRKYGDDFPESIREDFRMESKKLMRVIDLMTFNGRTLVMFAIVLSGHVWMYYLYEIFVLNGVLLFCMKRHESICSSFLNR